ncbi:Motility protein B [Fundidesulfovibrio magnetotacticus]|uniref:Motility protein B n=1 Tax=Fundidesulfovibrio magnetotacticus TaxID=2730080 RepID=A0A6V8LTA0_9BACT|nr:OmpA family protein [Fundidesulfovibrio magnetotacticus]GFK95693.1 Motility protein B [Fundidesulfovibrio magnetotacticus]
MADDQGRLEEEDEHEDIPQVWQITMADMSMLLLCFFIFLFSLATLKPENVSETLESVRQRLKSEKAPNKKTPGAQSMEEKVLEQLSLREQLIMRQRQVYQDLTAYFQGRGETTFKTTLQGSRMTVSVPSDGMFEANDVTQLTNAGKQRLLLVKDFLARHPDQRVHIKGFTDDTPPPPQARLRNNWEVSSLQAVSALRFLLSQGVPANRLTSTGLADLEPLLPNTSEANRARNRRLDFVMEVQVEG